LGVSGRRVVLPAAGSATLKDRHGPVNTRMGQVSELYSVWPIPFKTAQFLDGGRFYCRTWCSVWSDPVSFVGKLHSCDF